MSDERLAPPQHDDLDGVPPPPEAAMLVGHEAARVQVAEAYKAGKLPHALLLTGPRGVGKATLAFHIARHLLSHPHAAAAPGSLADVSPDSALFRQVASAAHPGVLHLTRPWDERAKKFKTVISVDEVRRVGHFLSMTSHDGGARVVIVDPADDMNIAAANALLKNLEEPPARTHFLLLAHSPGLLLPTIRSRCQLLRLSPLDDVQLGEVLRHLGLRLPEGEAGEEMVRRADGSVRAAILLAAFGGLDVLTAIDALGSAPALDIAAAHRLADAVAGRDNEIRFDLMNTHLLDTLAQAGARAAANGQGARADRYARSWQEMRVAIGETETYNLDRKQHTLNMILRLHETLRM
jgi:DNA polymerase-3 subunit delta'